MRPASRQEVDAYLASRGLSFDGDIKAKAYVIEIGVYSMLVVVCDLSDVECEVHIVCPKDYVIKSRELAQLGFLELSEMGYSTAYTAIKSNEHKTAHNFVRRIGFEQVGCYNEHIVYKRGL